MDDIKTSIIEFDLAHRTHQLVDLERIALDRPDPNKVYWIHCDLSDISQFHQIAKRIDLPSETVQLCLQRSAISKLIDYGPSLSLKFQCILDEAFKENREEHFGNIVIHLTQQYCFTAAKHTPLALTEFHDQYDKSLHFAKTSCFILFLILNNVVNDYAQFLFNYEISSDEMDIKVRENHENIYSTVANMKHRVIVIKRCTAAIREILMKISGKKMAAISDDCRASLLNILNQSQLVFNEIDSIRDMLNGLLSQIDYMLMHKMNKSIQILTAFAAIFLPLTLITGIYGMNFQHIPELAWKYGYVYALALILACGILLVLLFKVKKWF